MVEAFTENAEILQQAGFHKEAELMLIRAVFKYCENMLCLDRISRNDTVVKIRTYELKKNLMKALTKLEGIPIKAVAMKLCIRFPRMGTTLISSAKKLKGFIDRKKKNSVVAL